MRFDRLTVTNYRCFEETSIDFEAGVTVIRGVNGAGKSSLLEACFFALYGSAALRTADATLEDVITTDAEECTVELRFTHEGAAYRVRRELRRSQDRASQSVAVLEGPEGRIDGARAVDERIQSVFRMDAEAFLNCAYVRQGEVNKLIEASAEERQRTIDRLVRLGVLETYRERASAARLGVKHVRDGAEGALADVCEQLEERSEADLEEAREAVGGQLAEARERLSELRGNREAANERRSEAEATIEEHADRQADLEEAREALAEIETTIAGTERDREGVDERIGKTKRQAERAAETASTALIEAREVGVGIDTGANPEAVEEALDTLDDRREELTGQIETTDLRREQARENAEEAKATASEYERRAEAREDQAEELAASIADGQDELEATREELDSLEERIAAATERFDDSSIAFGEASELLAELENRREETSEERAEIAGNLKATRQAVERAEDLQEAGKCPTCGQPIEDSPHVHDLDDDRERLAALESQRTALDERYETLDERIDQANELVEIETTVSMLEDRRDTREQALDDKHGTIEQRRDQQETYHEEATEAREQAATARDTYEQRVEEANRLEDELDDLREQRTEIRERRDPLETARDAYEQRREASSERERLEERLDGLDELLDERRSQREKRRERVSDLEAAVDEDAVEAAREKRSDAIDRIEEVEGEIEGAESKQGGLQNQLGRIESELERIEELRERRSVLEAREQALSSLYEECADLQSMYGELRADLRQRNIAMLERLMNEVFDLAYRNDAYDRITLDGEYRATIHEKSGATLEPGKLSGGERVLFNLALRCGIYQLLVEGAEGIAPMPPLILDEPTAHLDAGHIDRIDGVVSRMREIGVEQTIVVSHTDELIDAADHRVVVEQRPASNRSEANAEGRSLV